MRVGTWNLNSRRTGRADRAAMVDLIRLADLDLLFLQEIYRSEMADFAALFDDAVISLHVPRSDGQVSGRVGCAVLARREVRLVADSESLLDGLPQPERGLTVQATVGGRPIWLLSWHAPNAAQHGRAHKEQAYRTVIGALAAQEGSVVAGMDTNMPHDWPDVTRAEAAHSQPDWRFQWELLGSDPSHRLRDVYRGLRERDGSLADAPVTGPLAQTVLVGGKPERFDRIYATPDLPARNVNHVFEAARAVGSDHALVVAVLQHAVGSE